MSCNTPGSFFLGSRRSHVPPALRGNRRSPVSSPCTVHRGPHRPSQALAAHRASQQPFTIRNSEVVGVLSVFGACHTSTAHLFASRGPPATTTTHLAVRNSRQAFESQFPSPENTPCPSLGVVIPAPIGINHTTPKNAQNPSPGRYKRPRCGRKARSQV